MSLARASARLRTSAPRVDLICWFYGGRSEPTNRLGHPVAPRLSVTGEDPGRIHVAQSLERCEGLDAIECEGRRTGTSLAGQDAACRHRIPDEQRIDAQEWYATLPSVWPGRPITVGAPGTSRVVPSVNVTTSVRAGILRPPRRAL